MERIAVLGAGTMGHGIAQVCAMAGHDVSLADTTEAFARSGADRIRANLDEGVKRGKLTEEAAAACMARITVATSLDVACSRADIVIEAVPEKVG
jgi:3-hydroxybutyryl-CoA dehydrogenase